MHFFQFYVIFQYLQQNCPDEFVINIWSRAEQRKARHLLFPGGMTKPREEVRCLVDGWWEWLCDGGAYGCCCSARLLLACLHVRSAVDEDFRSCLAARLLSACLHVSGGDWCRSCSPARLLLACLHVGSAVDDSLRSCLLAQLLLACLHVNNHVSDCIRILVEMRKMFHLLRQGKRLLHFFHWWSHECMKREEERKKESQ